MFIDNRCGNRDRVFLEKPVDFDMRIPEHLRQSVVYLGRKLDGAKGPYIHFAGTGFFVHVDSSIKDRGFVYLVTAKHVVEQLALGDWVMRANVKGGGFRDFEGKKDHKWCFHPTEHDSTDVAVTSIPDVSDLDWVKLHHEFLLDESLFAANGIGAGDDVFIIGLFNRMRGNSRNQPIVRTGNIALIPDPGERVPSVKIGINKYVDADAYLIEARSIGGVSGSPVFVRMTVREEVRVGFAQPYRDYPDYYQTSRSYLLPGPIYCMGLINGHWDIDPMLKNDGAQDDKKKNETVNLGIAIVIPAKKIKETLYHPDLIAERQKEDTEFLATQGSSTMD